MQNNDNKKEIQIKIMQAEILRHIDAAQEDIFLARMDALIFAYVEVGITPKEFNALLDSTVIFMEGICARAGVKSGMTQEKAAELLKVQSEKEAEEMGFDL